MLTCFTLKGSDKLPDVKQMEWECWFESLVETLQVKSEEVEKITHLITLLTGEQLHVIVEG